MLLKFAIQDFKEDREFKNVSEHTLNAYMFTLSDFHAYCANNEVINVDDITPTTIKGFLIHCQKVKGNNIVSRNSKLQRLKIFFNYLEDSEIITEKRNPTKKVSYAKTDVKIEVFNDYHIKQMLSYFRRLKSREKSLYSYRGYCIILTLLGTGMRLSELCNLQWNEVDLKNGNVILFGKNRQQTSIPITEKLIKELAEYRIFCEQEFGELSDHIFVNKDNQALTPNAVKCIFKRLKNIMNFRDVRLSAHTFRHTFAQRMLSAGCDVFTLQKMLRHSSLKMTERYLSLWGTALKEQNDKFNPLNHLVL